MTRYLVAIDLSVSVTGKYTVLCMPEKAGSNRSSSSTVEEPTRGAAEINIGFSVPTVIRTEKVTLDDDSLLPSTNEKCYKCFFQTTPKKEAPKASGVKRTEKIIPTSGPQRRSYV